MNRVFQRAIFIFASLFSIGVSANEGNAVRYLGTEVSHVVLSSISDRGRVVRAYPGERIKGLADCVIHRPTYLREEIQVIVGFDQIGAQDGIRNGAFQLVAPTNPGIYEVRFRYAQTYTIPSAVANWWNVDLSPPWQATIGLVVVSEDPENTVLDIDDSNWREWVANRHNEKECVSNEVQIYQTLTPHRIAKTDFWDETATTGQWQVQEGRFQSSGTRNFDERYQLLSKRAYKSFNFRITQKYGSNHNFDYHLWNNSRGFGVLYYINDRLNVEFRYFPYSGQLSLYVRDGEKYIEKMKPIYFLPGEEITYDIEVNRGKILWKVNGQVVFEETTTLPHGRLMLTNYNNQVTFEL
ncbi:MAG: hypothetical protein S4CHLAM123_13990 [Chlamydiales bacterium]|nr:hypothetical protein [Chlamydiales bacterium]